MEIENYAYIIIKDLQKNANIFEGWMFLKSTALIVWSIPLMIFGY